MNISAPKENYIFIELTGEDMKKLNITYADMDYSNVETRRVIWTLLDEAKHSLGREFEFSDNMKIEALPSLDGGCLLFFNIGKKPNRYKVRGKGSVLAYRFRSLDDAFDLSLVIPESEKSRIKSSLYLCSGEYVMVIDGKLRHSVIAKLSEFATPLAHKEREIAQITEYERCLIKDNALARLSFIS